MTSPTYQTKLVAVDLDGTLLRDDLTIHPRVLAAVQRLHEAGIRFCIATGRSSESAIRVTSAIGHRGPLVCSNGTHVLLSPDETLAYDFLPTEIVRQMTDWSLVHQIHISIYTTQGVVANRESRFLDLYRKHIAGPPVPVVDQDEVEQFQVLKIVFIDEPARIPSIRSQVEPLVEQFCSMTESAPEYLEILPKGANKQTGLQKLASHFGIQREEIAAIGDFLNDVEMLEWVGFSGAICTGHPRVLQIANQVFESNNEGGVASFIEEVLSRNG